MRPVLQAAQMGAADRGAEERGVPVEALMERAGHAVARAAAALLGAPYGRRVAAVCGKGNNAGDAFVAARLLAAWGAAPAVVAVAGLDELREAAAVNAGRLRDVGVPVLTWGTREADRAIARADVLVDGLFGSGFRGLAEGPWAAAIEAMNASPAPVVAADIPSGVEGDTGAVRGPAVRAEVTVTFAAPKVGVVLYPGAELAGRVEVADIGIPADLLESDLALVEPGDVAAILPRRAPDEHKHRSGDVLVVAGSRRMTGAPRLVAEGAARAGAGLVHVAVPEGIFPIVQAGLTEAVFLPLPEGPEGSVAASAWGELEKRMDRFDAVAIGPGLTTEGEAPDLVRALVRSSPVPIVADADALNAFADGSESLKDRSSELVITPHAGEFGRLFRVPAADLAEDRVGLVRKAAADTGAVTVLKGPRTLVALPGGEVRINPTGSAALATGGTGDVLAGAIAAYLARGLPPVEAATAAVYVHGLAGQVVGRRMGEGGTAEDVAIAIPAAVEAVLGSVAS
ncbi:MAG TPA: NAD(P)H-hydrate dehydratase [Actinomycetota bacterium]